MAPPYALHEVQGGGNGEFASARDQVDVVLAAKRQEHVVHGRLLTPDLQVIRLPGLVAVQLKVGELRKLGKGDVKVALPVAGDVHPGITAPQVEPMDVGVGVVAVNEGYGVNQVEIASGLAGLEEVGPVVGGVLIRLAIWLHHRRVLGDKLIVGASEVDAVRVAEPFDRLRTSCCYRSANHRPVLTWPWLPQ